MPNRRFKTGITLPSLWQLLFVGAVVCGGWLLWTEVQERRSPSDVAPTSGTPVDEMQRIEKLIAHGPAAVPELISELSDRLPRTRRNALYALGRIGSDASAAIGMVRKLLADDDPAVRSNAIYALCRISRDPDEIVTSVAPLLADRDLAMRLEAEKALTAVGVGATWPLVSELRSDLLPVRIGVVGVLRAIHLRAPDSEVVDAIREQIDHFDHTTRIHVFTALAGWRTARNAEIREILKSERVQAEASTVSDQRNSIEIALEATADLGPAAEEFLPDVVALFDDRQFLAEAAGQRMQAEPSVQRYPSFFMRVLWTLNAMKEAGRPALPNLQRLAEKADGYRRREIARTMIAVGAGVDDVAPILVPLLTGAPQDDPFSAGELLMQISPEEARHQVAILIPQLTHGDGSVNLNVLIGIHSLAPEAGEAVPALINILQTGAPRVLRITVNTLGRIGPAAAPAVPGLVAILRGADLDDGLCNDIVRGLGRIGPAAKDAVPAILAEINSPRRRPPPQIPDPYESNRTDAIGALAAVGQATPEVLEMLRGQLASTSWSVRSAAAKSLSELAGDAPAVLDDLVRLLHDEYAHVRAQAALAISNVTADRRAVVPQLAGALADESPKVRAAAAMALQKMGPDAKAALPALREAQFPKPQSLRRWSHAQANTQARPQQAMVWIKELDQISDTQAIRDAIAAIDTDDRSGTPATAAGSRE
jgi:HEAT repeat protein